MTGAKFFSFALTMSCAGCGRVRFDPLGDGGGDAGLVVPQHHAYLKASNTDVGDDFGHSVAVSADGSTVAVAAPLESSGSRTNQLDNSVSQSGAVYIFVRAGATWAQQVYIKAPIPDAFDQFGWSIALSGDGSTLAVGARFEGSNAVGIGGDATNNNSSASGAVFMFTRAGTTWTEQAYIKASNTDADDHFGERVSLSDDGNVLVAAAFHEASNATGLNGNQADNSAPSSGAVYVFERAGATWTQHAYLKASNTAASDQFGYGLALSGDGSTIAVGAIDEDSSASGVNRDEASDAAPNSGAVYVFVRNGASWQQQAYLKASNTDAGDLFGFQLAMSSDGSSLCVSSDDERSSATGTNGDQTSNAVPGAGAVYAFRRVGTTWSQTAYIKPSNTDVDDGFGDGMAMNADGSVIAISSVGDSSASPVAPVDNSLPRSGSLFLFDGTPAQRAYLKAPAPSAADEFGWSVALSGDARVLVVGAWEEDSAATGIDGDETNESAMDSGAAYVAF